MKTLLYIGIFLLIGILNTIISAEYIKLLQLPSGEVAMLPIGVMVVSGISLGVSTILVLIINIRNQISLTTSILMYHIIYFMTSAYFGLEWPTSDFSFTNINLITILTGCIVWISIFACIKFFQSVKD